MVVHAILHNGLLCFVFDYCYNSCFTFVQTSSGTRPIDTIAYRFIPRKTVVANFKFPTASASHYIRKIICKWKQKWKTVELNGFASTQM